MPRKTKTKSKAKKPRKQRGGKGKKKTGRGVMKLPKFIEPLMPPPFVMM